MKEVLVQWELVRYHQQILNWSSWKTGSLIAFSLQSSRPSSGHFIIDRNAWNILQTSPSYLDVSSIRHGSRWVWPFVNFHVISYFLALSTFAFFLSHFGSKVWALSSSKSADSVFLGSWSSSAIADHSSCRLPSSFHSLEGICLLPCWPLVVPDSNQRAVSPYVPSLCVSSFPPLTC